MEILSEKAAVLKLPALHVVGYFENKRAAKPQGTMLIDNTKGKRDQPRLGAMRQ
jgi:hypothetical protein